MIYTNQYIFHIPEINDIISSYVTNKKSKINKDLRDILQKMQLLQHRHSRCHASILQFHHVALDGVTFCSQGLEIIGRIYPNVHPPD